MHVICPNYAWMGQKLTFKVQLGLAFTVLMQNLCCHLLETRKVPTQCAIYHVNVVCETVTGECLLERLLSFTTGLDRVPPLGFDPQLTLVFLHDGGQFPVANTCANILNIPLLPDYGTFYQHMCAALTMCCTFTKEWTIAMRIINCCWSLVEKLQEHNIN